MKVPVNLKFKKLIFFYVVRKEGVGLLEFLKRQALGFVSLVVGTVLSVPGVPGPGFVFFILAFLLIDFPKKKAAILFLRQKRWFRVARIVVRKKMNILLVLPNVLIPVQN